MLFLLATSLCAVCYEPEHSTLSCWLVRQKMLPNVVAIHKRHLKRTNGDGHQKQPFCSNCRFNNSCCVRKNYQISSSAGHNARVLQFACYIPPHAKHYGPRVHGQTLPISIFLTRHIIVRVPFSVNELTETLQSAIDL